MSPPGDALDDERMDTLATTDTVHGVGSSNSEYASAERFVFCARVAA